MNFLILIVLFVGSFSLSWRGEEFLRQLQAEDWNATERPVLRIKNDQNATQPKPAPLRPAPVAVNVERQEAP